MVGPAESRGDDDAMGCCEEGISIREGSGGVRERGGGFEESVKFFSIEGIVEDLSAAEDAW